MLLDQLGLVRKTGKAGQNSGYPPDLDIRLGFEMWATVRYLFFTQDGLELNLILHGDPIQGWTLRTADYAGHIADECAPELRRAALDRFGVHPLMHHLSAREPREQRLSVLGATSTR